MAEDVEDIPRPSPIALCHAWLSDATGSVGNTEVDCGCGIVSLLIEDSRLGDNERRDETVISSLSRLMVEPSSITKRDFRVLV